MVGRLHVAGLIEDLCEGQSFEARMVSIDKEYEHANVVLHRHGVFSLGIQVSLKDEAEIDGVRAYVHM